MNLDVQVPASCNEWTGAKDKDGYGRHAGKLIHRKVWEETYGPIPKGMCVLHSCDNPPCREPEHLFLGTRQDNMNDMKQKSRSPHINKVQCLYGHQLDGLYKGRRYCKTCLRLRSRERRSNGIAN